MYGNEMEAKPSKLAFSTTLQTADPEDFANAVRGANLRPCQLGDPAPSAYARLDCPRVSLDLASLGTTMSYSGTLPADCFTLVFITACPTTGRSLSFGIEHTDGYIGLFPPGAAFAGVKPGGYRHGIITVPTTDFLGAIIRHAPEVPDELLAHGSAMRVAPADQAVLRGLLSELEETIWNEPTSFARAATRRDAEADLLAAYLAALRHGCGEAITSRPRLARRYGRLRRAMDFLNAHAHEPIHLDDLCAELGSEPPRRGVHLS